jgi:hypothetical protein
MDELTANKALDSIFDTQLEEEKKNGDFSGAVYTYDLLNNVTRT